MTEWNVIAEVDVAPTEKRAEGWMDALAPYSPAVGRTMRGRSELIITLPAKSLEQAVATGLAVLQRAARQLASFSVMTTAEYDRRADEVEVPELIGATEAAAMLGVTRQAVQQMTASGRLPSRTVGRSLVIPRPAVEALAAQRHAEPVG